MKYIRTTHINGTPKTFSKEAEQAWQTDNTGFVGHILSETEPLSVYEIWVEIVDYCDHDDDSDILSLHEIRKALEVLVKYGMAEEKE